MNAELFVTICQVLTVLYLSGIVVVIVGYWCGADYYFELDDDFIEGLQIASAVTGVCTVAIVIACLIAKQLEAFFTIVPCTIALCYSLYLFICFGVWIVGAFERSREKMWAKRGK